MIGKLNAAKLLRDASAQLFPRDSAAPGADHPLIDRILELGMKLAIFAGALLLVAHFGNLIFLGGDVDPLNAQAEGNTPTWASVVAAFAGAFAAGLLALLPTWNRRQAGAIVAIAVILAFLSLDDFVRIHESLETTVRDLAGLEGDQRSSTRIARAIVDQVELLVLLPVEAAGLLLMWMLSGGLALRIGRALRVGLLLLGAAVALEFSGTATRGVDWLFKLTQGVEEAFELGAWILIAAALTAALCAGLMALARASSADSPPPLG